MPIATVPQRNTFVHFQEQALPDLLLDRSVTCPGNYVTLPRSCSSSCSALPTDFGISPMPLYDGPTSNMVPLTSFPNDASDDASPLKRTDSVRTAYAWPSLSALQKEAPRSEAPSTSSTDCCQDAEASIDRSVDDECLLNQKVPTVCATRRWADISEDERTPLNRCEHSELSKSSQVEVQERWADLSEVEECSNDKKITTDVLQERSEDNEDEKLTASAPKVSFKPSRPQFAKPSREARTRQFQAKLDEFFELDFDQVDPSQQDGLTHRMLVGLKSLAEVVSFWQPDGTQVSEEGFKLLSLEEADMYALGRVIRKADKLLEERRFREAYDKLCTARRWFDAETLDEERAKAAARAEKNPETKPSGRSKQKAFDSDADDEDWTQVTKKDKKKTSDDVVQKFHGVKDSDKSGWKKPAKKSNQKSQYDNKTVAGTAKSSGPAQKARGPQKNLCRYIVGIDQDRAFNVLRKLLGDRGSHMKFIAENTGAKLRIRGRGSGFLEGPDQTEAPDPLMLCISAPSREGFESAVQDVESLLEHVHDQYLDFCRDRKIPVPKLLVVQSEQPSVR